MKRRGCALLVVLLAAACTGAEGAGDTTTTTTDGTSSSAPTTSSPDEPGVRESDVRLILGLWDHLEQASEGGLDSWGQAVVDSQYPGFGVTVDQCTYLNTEGESFRVAYEADRSSITPEPDWTVPDFSPGSPMSGTRPAGRIYSVSVGASFGGSPEVHENTQYVTVRNGEVFWFPICETD